MLLIYLLRLRHKQVQPPVRPPQRLDGLRALVAAQDELLVEREEGRERVALRRRQRGVPDVDGDEARAELTRDVCRAIGVTPQVDLSDVA